jgi:hypothetical protein
MVRNRPNAGYAVLVGILCLPLLVACGGGGGQSPASQLAPAMDLHTPQADIQEAFDLVAQVRAMADVANNPIPGTLLAHFVSLRLQELPNSQPQALCSDYTTTLVQKLEDAGVALPFRNRALAFNDRAHDSHAIVEILDTDSARWLVLDPTFAIQTLNADGLPATAAEISTAARTLNWNLLSFHFLTPAGDAYARSYYLDYPLLYLNVYDGPSTTPVEPSVPLTPYLDYLGVSVDVYGTYTSPCTAQDPNCSDGYYGLLYQAPYDNPAGIYSPHWFVFAPAN